MKNKIINILKDVLDCKVDENTSMDKCDKWDSFNHVNVILELQDKFGIKIPYDDIDKLKSVKDIENYLKNKDLQ